MRLRLQVCVFLCVASSLEAFTVPSAGIHNVRNARKASIIPSSAYTLLPTNAFTSSSSTQLFAKDDNNNEKEETDESKKESKVQLPKKVQAITKLLITKFMNFFPTLRVAISSFTVGAVFALTLIFVPVYNSVDKMSEPVTLFETILAVSFFFVYILVNNLICF